MRCKVLFVIATCLLATIGFSQDINRAKEWHVKRAEQPEAKVMQQMKFNGVADPVGEDPTVLDERGNPTSLRKGASGGLDKSEAQATNTVRKQSDRLVRNEFEVAGAVVDTPEKGQTSPVLVGSIFLIVGLLLAAAFSMATKKIKVPGHS